MADLLAPRRLGGGRVELIHDVGASRDRAARQPAGDDLGQHAHVGRDAEARLRAAARPAETRDHLVEDQHDAALLASRRAARRGSPSAAAPCPTTRPTPRGSRPRCRRAVSASRPRRATSSAGSRMVCSTSAGGNAGRHAAVEVRHRAGRDLVVPAVKVADEAHHLRLAGEGAREAQREMRGLGARRREAHALGARDQALDQLRPAHLELVRGAPVRALRHLRAAPPRPRPDARDRAAARRARRNSRRTRCRRRPTCAGPPRAPHRSDRAAACGDRGSARPG